MKKAKRGEIKKKFRIINLQWLRYKEISQSRLFSTYSNILKILTFNFNLILLFSLF
jgi:hypothetical protein